MPVCMLHASPLLPTHGTPFPLHSTPSGVLIPAYHCTPSKSQDAAQVFTSHGRISTDNRCLDQYRDPATGTLEQQFEARKTKAGAISDG
eukprot:scaffold111938_cov16-Tisochrysis_lutea.AAC.1